MTLQQYHSLKVWHRRHWRDHPVEKNVWDTILTLWMSGWMGAPAALLINAPWAEAASFALLFLPGLYVALRIRLHRRGQLRCDWITALR
jgi:hypothetical protein